MKWSKINKKDLVSCTRFIAETKLKLFEQFIDTNYLIEYRNSCWYGTTILRFMENKGRIAGREFISLKQQIPNIEHEYIYRNVYGDIFIISHTSKDEETIIKAAHAIEKEITLDVGQTATLTDFNNWNDGNYKIDIFGKEKSWYNPNNTTLFVFIFSRTFVLFSSISNEISFSTNFVFSFISFTCFRLK